MILPFMILSKFWFRTRPPSISAGFRHEFNNTHTMLTDTVIQALLSLPVEQRIDLAYQLYASVPEDWQKSVDQAWLEEAERRYAEMDADPNMALSYDEFMAGLEINQRRA